MYYTSTRDSSVRVSSAMAIAKGISDDGGLFVPTEIPMLSAGDITALGGLDYIGRAEKILSLFLDDFSPAELHECTVGAYRGTFENDAPAPLYELEKGVNILELWHGPTCAFKDLALQILPRLLTKASEKTDGGKTKVVLVATSGDTGKAALEGFADVAGTKILVFYPEDGVSAMQKLQMITQEGENVSVCAIKGNFDDAQTGVKKIFTDPGIKSRLEESSMAFSSANSINWGRLAPQIVYYVSAYCDLLGSGKIKEGEKIDVVVPTGNFGNILAAFYAREMGVPIDKLVCASNRNNILTDFINTGIYDRNREFYTTSSPSMDILISSNLERLLYHLSDGNSPEIKKYMSELSENGVYTVGEKIKQRISSVFRAGCCDEKNTASTIADTCDRLGYLCDTHTAVAVNVFRQYKSDCAPGNTVVIASTASPFKFSSSVLHALSPVADKGSEFEKVHTLSVLTGIEAPVQLCSLEKKTVRFTENCEKEKMKDAVLSLLGI